MFMNVLYLVGMWCWLLRSVCMQHLLPAHYLMRSATEGNISCFVLRAQQNWAEIGVPNHGTHEQQLCSQAEKLETAQWAVVVFNLCSEVQ
jgi:hypothetical protein